MAFHVALPMPAPVPMPEPVSALEVHAAALLPPPFHSQCQQRSPTYILYRSDLPKKTGEPDRMGEMKANVDLSPTVDLCGVMWCAAAKGGNAWRRPISLGILSRPWRTRGRGGDGGMCRALLLWHCASLFTIQSPNLWDFLRIRHHY